MPPLGLNYVKLVACTKALLMNKHFKHSIAFMMIILRIAYIWNLMTWYHVHLVTCMKIIVLLHVHIRVAVFWKRDTVWANILFWVTGKNLVNGIIYWKWDNLLLLITIFGLTFVDSLVLVNTLYALCLSTLTDILRVKEHIPTCIFLSNALVNFVREGMKE